MEHANPKKGNDKKKQQPYNKNVFKNINVLFFTVTICNYLV